jgi:hypothetical protein
VAGPADQAADAAAGAAPPATDAVAGTVPAPLLAAGDPR